MQPTLCTLGFSTRALARAASDAGYSVHAIDYFQDQDLQEICAWFRPSPPKTAEIPALIGEAPVPELVVLAGGAEELGAELRELWESKTEPQYRSNAPVVLGPTVVQLRLLRDPVNLAALARETGLQVPLSRLGEISETANGANPPADRFTTAIIDEEFGVSHVLEGSSRRLGERVRWLQKPFQGAGGWKILEVDAGRAQTTKSSRPPQVEMGDSYLQQYVPGRSLGVTCLLLRDQEPVCLAATQSWDAEEWPGPTPFIYRGSWGPVPLSESQVEAILNFAAKVQAQTGLLGWLPMDFVESEDGRLWLLEINPRWTAGMEVLHDCGFNVLPLHLAACLTPATAQRINPAILGGLRPHTLVEHRTRWRSAKAIVYAEENTALSQSHLAQIHSLPRSDFADLPSETGVIEAGQPILTVKSRLAFATQEETQRAMLEQLLQARERVLQMALR
ncbi:MAG: ATP-grasp domain-containing protein [Pirellulaceae bacterium]